MNPEQDSVITYDEDGLAPPPPQNSRLDMDTDLQNAMSMARRINRKIGEDGLDYLAEEEEVLPQTRGDVCTRYLKSIWSKVTSISKSFDPQKIVVLFVVVFIVLLIPSVSLGDSMTWLTSALGQADTWQRALGRSLIAVLVYTLFSVYM